MNIIGSIRVVTASVFLILCLSSYHSLILDTQLSFYSLYAQNVAQPPPPSLNNSRDIFSYPVTSSVSEIVSPNNTVVPSHSTPYSLVEPPVSSSETILTNYTAPSEFLSSESFTSIDASISRNAEILDGSSLKPFTTVFANESNSSVRGTNIR
jgi:hypothetical protein